MLVRYLVLVDDLPSCDERQHIAAFAPPTGSTAQLQDLMETQRVSSKWLPRDDANPLYDPFRRYDQYGTMGVTPQPWWEYVRLGLLAVTLLPLKFVGTLGATPATTPPRQLLQA